MAAGRGRRAARRRKAGLPANRPKSKLCEKTGKLGYATQADAVAAMAQFSRSQHFRGQRAYQCPDCERWHTTSQLRRD